MACLYFYLLLSYIFIYTYIDTYIICVAQCRLDDIYTNKITFIFYLLFVLNIFIVIIHVTYIKIFCLLVFY